jgi:hypothetical protein
VNSEIPIGLRLWSHLWSYGRELREELAVELGSNQSSGFHIFWVLGLYHANTPEVPICERRLLAWPEVITSWSCGGEDSALGAYLRRWGFHGGCMDCLICANS